MEQFIDFFLHLDKHLEQFFIEYKTLTYFIIALILFCETGLVVMPFLPGDSLLFAVGATIAKIGVLQLEIVIPLMLLAVLLGDNVNYFIGSRIGVKIFEWKIPILSRFLKPEYLKRTEEFYEKHGGKTIIMARFVPIVRTFAPFVAGIGTMTYRRYLTFCIIGALLWVISLTMAGYIFGNIEWVRKNFELVVISIVLISVMPMIFQFLKSKLAAK
jgi:membrane-associated protein